MGASGFLGLGGAPSPTLRAAALGPLVGAPRSPRTLRSSGGLGPAGASPPLPSRRLCSWTPCLWGALPFDPVLHSPFPPPELLACSPPAESWAILGALKASSDEPPTWVPGLDSVSLSFHPSVCLSPAPGGRTVEGCGRTQVQSARPGTSTSSCLCGAPCTHPGSAGAGPEQACLCSCPRAVSVAAFGPSVPGTPSPPSLSALR